MFSCSVRAARGNHRVGVTLILDLGAGGRWIHFYLYLFYNLNLPISNLPKNKIWFAQIRVRAATPILHLVDALSFLYCTNLEKKSCCVCGKGEGRGKGVKGACVGGCSPSLWSSPAAVGCSLPCFYKKLLFRVDLLDFFCRYDPSLRCLSLGLAGSSISGAGGRWIHFFYIFLFGVPISNLQSKQKKNKIPPGQNRVRAATPTR